MRNKRDKKRRLLVAKYEIKRLSLKYIINNLKFNEEARLSAQKKLRALPTNSSKVRIRNRCVLTGRARGVYKDFKLSRIMFRDLALKGLLPGIKKASW